MSLSDLSYDEMQELILQFSEHAGNTRAQVLQEVAVQWKVAQP